MQVLRFLPHAVSVSAHTVSRADVHNSRRHDRKYSWNSSCIRDSHVGPYIESATLGGCRPCLDFVAGLSACSTIFLSALSMLQVHRPRVSQTFHSPPLISPLPLPLLVFFVSRLATALPTRSAPVCSRCKYEAPKISPCVESSGCCSISRAHASLTH